jgi:KaiC/GvpD/RAD55 family RecA-like ATPase
MDLDFWLQQLKNVEKSAFGYWATCPAHDDSGRSLAIIVKEDGKSFDLQCMEGCTIRELNAAVGLAPPLNARSQPTAEPILVPMADIQAMEQQWVWPGRIPVGYLSMIVGLPGTGKSLLSLDMAARLSRAADWPDGAKNSGGATIIVAVEDDAPTVIRPRLLAADADMSKIFHFTGSRSIASKKFRPWDMERAQDLDDAIQRVPDAKLVILDPLSALAPKWHSLNCQTTVRYLFDPLTQIAASRNVAIIIVAHLRKSEATVASDRVHGSIAITASARSVWTITEDPAIPGRRLFLCSKMILGEKPAGLSFTVTGEQPRIAWDDYPVPLTADDISAETENLKTYIRQKRYA